MEFHNFKAVNIMGKFQAEVETRHYIQRFGLKSYSGDPIIDKYTEVIKSDNLVDLSKMLNEYGIVKDNYGTDALKIAIYLKKLNAVKIILNKCEYVLHDLSLFAYACENYNNYEPSKEELDIVLELLKCSNVDYNYKGGSLNELPLYYAINNDDLKIANILLQSKITVTKTNFGQTVLQCAIFNNKTNAIKLLISHPNYSLTHDEIETIMSSGMSDIISFLFKSEKLGKDNLTKYFTKIISRKDIANEVFSLFLPYVDVNATDIYGKTALIYCCAEGYLDKLVSILSCIDIDCALTDNSNMNALMHAVSSSNYIVTKTLVDLIKLKSIDVRKKIYGQKNESDENAVILAAKNNSDSIFSLLCESNEADLNCIDLSGNSSLYYAIDKNNNAIFDLLIDNDNVDVNIQDSEGNTMLMHAIKKLNTLHIYKLLNHKNIDLNVKNHHGQNVFSFVISKKNGISPKSETTFDGFSSPSSYALLSEAFTTEHNFINAMNMRNTELENILGKSLNPEMCTNKLIHYLIKKDIDFNSFDIYDKTPLGYAIDNRDTETFNLLLNLPNLDVNIQNSQGQTYLMYLFEKIHNAKSSQISAVANLDWNQGSELRLNDQINNYYSIKPTNTKLESFNQSAIPKIQINKPVGKTLENLDSVYFTYFNKLLGHKNLDINATDYLNNTILLMVSDTPNINLLRKLLNHPQINLNCQNYQGASPFMISIRNESWNNAKLLIEKGANPDLVDSNGHTVKKYLGQQGLFTYHKLFGHSTETEKEKGPQISEFTEINKKGWFS